LADGLSEIVQPFITKAKEGLPEAEADIRKMYAELLNVNVDDVKDVPLEEMKDTLAISLATQMPEVA
jgi:hypothetical protein